MTPPPPLPKSFWTGCFVLCWTPGLVVLLLDGLGCDRCQVLRYEKYCLVLAECNSFVNPIIYSLRDKDMRATFLEILCCGSRQKKNHFTSAVHFNTLDQEVPAERIGEKRPAVQPIPERSVFLLYPVLVGYSKNIPS